MDAKITREVLESYLKCKYKGHLKLICEQGSVSSYELLQRESREHIRQAATDKLVTRYKEVDVISGTTLTLTLLKQGRPVILDATIDNKRFELRFDALQKEAGSSRLGDFHYIPVLFDEAEKPHMQHKALLELYGLIIGELQGHQPQSGILLHGRECNVKRFKLNTSAQNAGRILEEIREIQNTNTAPMLILNRHCQICEFAQRCYAEATKKDDLSLLQGLGEKEIRKYNRRGIVTVTQLSYTFRPQKRSKQAKQKNQPHNPALQALAIRDKKIYVLGTPQLPRASTQIYFDLEGDPERGYEYLLGMIIVRDGVEEHRSFWVDSQAEERQLFRQFLDVVDLLGRLLPLLLR